MDGEKMDDIAERVASAEVGDDPVARVDEALDHIVAALMVIGENLPQVRTASEGQRMAIERVTELVETAIAPYTSDIIEAMQEFED